ncbi:helix-turn-helix domain-containing protein [Burkholderia anthina]|uniref:helix-turn-helix domain-containing protein n=1 Tax=Burkholderia anthina TaxID=179879 RepID=UPI0009BD8B4A|nr:AraC family transcriptional regulator [Burkholderia anthina]
MQANLSPRQWIGADCGEERRARQISPPARAQLDTLLSCDSDPIVSTLVELLLYAVDNANAVPDQFSEGIMLALQGHVLGLPSAVTQSARHVARGGLASWQEKKVKHLIENNLDGSQTLDRLACECQLSPGHFARAFKASTGVSPHQWLQRARVARAKKLLAESDVSLSEIATACGFSDQSHMTKVFGQHVGTTPRLWQRERRIRKNFVPPTEGASSGTEFEFTA